MRKFILLWILTLFLIFPREVAASRDNSFVSIVNPIRVSDYTANTAKSVRAQYNVVNEYNLPATWLLSYQGIKDGEIAEAVKSFNKDQELGIFLEISQSLCENSGVLYDKSFSWHHAANIFLTGYSQQDRIKLIDKAFEDFANVFGYYPSSVGAWWIDSYSLNYMRGKYGIEANLGLADQYSTDGYRVWGTYWSTPFYPSNIHAGIPAGGENKINVVTVPWAPRDPLNGYFDSYYSTQDYLQTKEKLDTEYFEELVKLYGNSARNKFGHIVVGLESDLNPEAFTGEYANQLAVISKLQNENKVQSINLKNFANWYKNQFNKNTPVHFIESDDLLGNSIKTFWFNSPRYRIAINYDKDKKNVEIFDFRVYQDNFQEPYFYNKNKDFRLLIDIPSIADKFILDNSWTIDTGNLTGEEYQDNSIALGFDKGKIVLNEDNIDLEFNELETPEYFKTSQLIRLNQNSSIVISPREEFGTNKEGYVFKNLKPEIINYFKLKRGMALIAITLVFILSVLILIFKTRFGNKTKLLLTAIFILALGTVFTAWFDKNSNKYFVSQAEIDVLDKLRLLEPGDVIVFDKQCFGCEWSSPDKPAVFDNLRNYVAKFSRKDVIYNKSVFEAKDQVSAREEFNNTKAKYIYVVNYESYKEKVPFSPGDLGIELYYENANSQVWRKL